MTHSADTRAAGLLRSAEGQPACARALVAAGRAGAVAGLSVALRTGLHRIESAYPLRDGSGWALLFAGCTGLRVDDPRILSVGAQ